VRVKIDAEVRDLSEEIILDKNKKHHIDVIIDRLIIKGDIKKRLADSLETALNLSEGIVKVEIIGGEELTFSEKFACIDCGISYPEITPRMFSFNNPYGACPTCGGLGTTMHFDPDLVLPNPSLSLREGAILPWAGRNSSYFHQMLDALSEHYEIDIYTPFKDLSPEVQHALLYGSGEEKIKFYFELNGRKIFHHKEFEGVISNLER